MDMWYTILFKVVTYIASSPRYHLQAMALSKPVTWPPGIDEASKQMYLYVLDFVPEPLERDLDGVWYKFHVVLLTKILSVSMTFVGSKMCRHRHAKYNCQYSLKEPCNININCSQGVEIFAGVYAICRGGQKLRMNMKPFDICIDNAGHNITQDLGLQNILEAVFKCKKGSIRTPQLPEFKGLLECQPGPGWWSILQIALNICLITCADSCH